MPNWTFNVLYVRGDVKTVNSFMERCTIIDEKGVKNILSYSGILPMPNELNIDETGHPSEELKLTYKENEKKFGHKNWYSWRLANWGVKWDISCDGVNLVVKDEGKTLRYEFSSPWNSPQSWFEKAVEIFPTLELSLYSQYESCEECSKVWNEGTIVYDLEMSAHDFKMELWEKYRKLVDFITNGDYEEVIKHCSNVDYVIDIAGSEPEGLLLNRIKREDLPLFVNYPWEHNKDLFNKRIKGEEECITK